MSLIVCRLIVDTRRITQCVDVHDRLAKNLRTLRHAIGWSQEELAHQADIHRTYISDLERAARNPSIEVVERIAKALKASMGELLD